MVNQDGRIAAHLKAFNVQPDDRDMSKRRHVVVDLNALDNGLPHYNIREADYAVLPHMMISDLAGNERREKHANCFPRWLRKRGNCHGAL